MAGKDRCMEVAMLDALREALLKALDGKPVHLTCDKCGAYRKVTMFPGGLCIRHAPVRYQEATCKCPVDDDGNLLGCYESVPMPND